MTTEPFLLWAAAHRARAYGRCHAAGPKGAVRIAAEVPLMVAAFALGVPMLAVIIAGSRVRVPLSPPTPPSPEIGDIRCGSRTGGAGGD